MWARCSPRSQARAGSDQTRRGTGARALSSPRLRRGARRHVSSGKRTCSGRLAPKTWPGQGTARHGTAQGARVPGQGRSWPGQPLEPGRLRRGCGARSRLGRMAAPALPKGPKGPTRVIELRRRDRPAEEGGRAEPCSPARTAALWEPGQFLAPRIGGRGPCAYPCGNVGENRAPSRDRGPGSGTDPSGAPRAPRNRGAHCGSPGKAPNRGEAWGPFGVGVPSCAWWARVLVLPAGVASPRRRAVRTMTLEGAPFLLAVAVDDAPGPHVRIAAHHSPVGGP
jgi:hypothetical protein